MILTTDLPQTKMTWRYVLLEVKELIEEVKKGNRDGIVNELCDVYTSMCCALTTHTRVPIPIFWMRSANEWIHRLEIWEQIFKVAGLKFDVKYLREGGNYRKDTKIVRALELAIEDQIDNGMGDILICPICNQTAIRCQATFCNNLEELKEVLK